MSNVSIAGTAEQFNPQAAAAYIDRLRANVPAELLSLRQLVTWRRETRNGKPTKVLYSPHTGRPAETNNPATWGTPDEACAAYMRGGYDGLGFVFSGDEFCGIDFDKCIDADGTLRPDVQRHVKALNSYTERSPSGTGLHVFIKADMPGGRGRKSAEHGIEAYSQLRYFTLTGDWLPGTPRTIHHRQHELDELLAAVFPAKATPARPLKEPPRATVITTPTRTAPPPALPDDAVIERMCESPAAWHLFVNGRGRGSQSELDWRLACFAFEAGATFDQADRIMRRSALMRAKWDEPHGLMTYGELTLAKAQGHVEAQRSAALQGGE